MAELHSLLARGYEIDQASSTNLELIIHWVGLLTQTDVTRAASLTEVRLRNYWHGDGWMKFKEGNAQSAEALAKLSSVKLYLK